MAEIVGVVLLRRVFLASSIPPCGMTRPKLAGGGHAKTVDAAKRVAWLCGLVVTELRVIPKSRPVRSFLGQD